MKIEFYTNFGLFQDHPNPPKGVYLEKLIEKDPKTNKNGPKSYILIVKMSGRTLSSLEATKNMNAYPIKFLLADLKLVNYFKEMYFPYNTSNN